MAEINDINEIKFIFDEISSPMNLSLVVEAWKSIIRKKLFQIINHFYKDYYFSFNDLSLHRFGLGKKNVLINLLIIKDVLIKPIKSNQKLNKTMINEFSGIDTCNKEIFYYRKKSYSRNKLLRFFNNASIIKKLIQFSNI